MNILIDTLPEAIEIDGRVYTIRSDFRACLRIITAFEDNALAGIEKRQVLLVNLYKDPPSNLISAFEAGIKFLNMGEEGHDDGGPRVYSFSKDANLIFAAFRQTHGIDLGTAELHWWKFLALFMDLGADTAFCNLVSLRKRVKTGKATKEERQAAREMGEAFNLPEVDTRNLEEREAEAEFMRLLGSGDHKDRPYGNGE